VTNPAAPAVLDRPSNSKKTRLNRRSSQFIETHKMTTLPKYKDLPPVEGMPHGCAWGIWDKPGQPKDQLGSLNLLTPEVVQQAIKEVKTGERCALKSVVFFTWADW
jgi:CO dehydrogenase/acetyl-CoA synthase delta subunit